MQSVTQIYHAIFYDVEKPQDFRHAMQLKIDKNQFHNLTDDMGPKDIELKDVEGGVATYTVQSFHTFHTKNYVDYTMFAIFMCKKKK